MRSSGELTPMLRQYLELKGQYPDAILLYRMGDFYEAFYEDARLAAELLELTLTARHRGSDHEAPMCGVPHHAVEGYVARLLRAGHKVAICDQMEEAAQARGLVRREITRVLTPGTLTEPGLLDGREANPLVALAAAGSSWALAGLELSTGELSVRRLGDTDELLAELHLLRPREVLLPPQELPAAVAAWVEREVLCRTRLAEADWPTAAEAEERLARRFGVATLRGFGLLSGEPALAAAQATLAYAERMQRTSLSHVAGIELRQAGHALALDATTFANLEVFRGAREGSKAPSLLGVLDRTASAAGGRRLREWLRRPLRDPVAIGRRLDGVESLLAAPSLRESIRAGLGRLADLERLAGRAQLGALTPREAAAIRDSLAELPALLAAAGELPALTELAAADPLADLATDLARSLVEAPASSAAEGLVMGTGVDEELDLVRSLARDSKVHVLALETRERERTGIPSLKVRYNRVFGYSIEITRAHQEKVPSDYQRRQTLVNAERYVTEELRRLEEQILHAEERRAALEAELFAALRGRVAARSAGLAALGRALADLDALSAFAEVAARRGYSRPLLLPSGAALRIEDGRHPVVEAHGRDAFVPNDTRLDPASEQIVILTGPNMGGKSTYLRQVALISLLAHLGSFVPARRAEVPLLDRIFSRVGASDDLARGESTFMVEMIETANIVRHATGESLVILDEVGRGTATFDGLSLAWAIVEYLHEKRRPLTLFATHYHELTELADLLPRVVNRTLAVKEWEEKILFLRRVVPGAADKSYGLHVARLAGLPADLIARAGEVLANLEADEYDPGGRPRRARGALPTGARPEQLALFTPPAEEVAQALREADLDRLAPIDALNLLHSLREKLG